MNQSGADRIVSSRFLTKTVVCSLRTLGIDLLDITITFRRREQQHGRTAWHGILHIYGKGIVVFVAMYLVTNGERSYYPQFDRFWGYTNW